MTYETIRFEELDGYAAITLDRPDKLNSFNLQMHAEVADALEQVREKPLHRALLITGAGRGFCAGQDLSDRKPLPDGTAPDLGASLDQYYNPLIRAIRGLPKPVVCAVNGVAAGSGANIALAADLVIAGQAAKFIQSFCRLGLLPDAGGTWHLPRLVGHARASAMAMLGEPVSAVEAERIGLIYRVVEDEQLQQEAHSMCEHLAAQPTRGLATIKAALQASWHHSLDAQLDLERDTQRQLGRTSDYSEGVAAFLGKRPPRFTGT